MLLVLDKAPIHPVIDERIDASLTHRQPVEEKVDVADVGDGGDLRVVVGVDEVDVVGSPAHHKDQNNQGEHQHHLAICKIYLLGWSTLIGRDSSRLCSD